MIYISIGSNIEHRLQHLQQAFDLLKEHYLKNIQCSMILETECILPPDAPTEWNKPFLNMIVAGNSDLSPEDLLLGLKRIEHEMGRPILYEKWSPRIIDLDILLWDELVIVKPQLKIPHLELYNRPFLLHLLKMMSCSHQSLPSKFSPPRFIKSLAVSPKLVGIVNVTPDSFSDGGLYNTTDLAIQKIMSLAADGASVIEIGAQSTRPGAVMQSPSEEYAKLAPILDNLKTLMLNKTITISVDTFWSSTINQLLKNYPIAWINDVKGTIEDQTIKLMIEHECNLCIMHSLSIPPNKDILIPNDKPSINTIIHWAKKNIERLLSLGFKQKSIIIDPGIGFGKSAYQNIDILRNIESLKILETKILIGHSRKSFMETFSTISTKDRDIETIAISSLLANKVDFLRVHNVVDHMRFFTSQTWRAV